MEEALAEYGRNAGLAFQLVDDLLDFTASPEQLGKPVLSDLKEGKGHAAADLCSAERTRARNGETAKETAMRMKKGGSWWRRFSKSADFVSVRPEQITKLVRETGALDARSNLAREYVSRAKACLEELPDTEYRRALLAVPDFILEREN